MDLFVMICRKTWDIFASTGFTISYEGNAYYISLYGLLIFTTVTAIVIYVVKSFLD